MNKKSVTIIIIIAVLLLLITASIVGYGIWSERQEEKQRVLLEQEAEKQRVLLEREEAERLRRCEEIVPSAASDPYPDPVVLNNAPTVINFYPFSSESHVVDFENSGSAVKIREDLYKVYCKLGSNQGENTNHYYCGRPDLPIIVKEIENGRIGRTFNTRIIYDSVTKSSIGLECN